MADTHLNFLVNFKVLKVTEIVQIDGLTWAKTSF